MRTLTGSNSYALRHELHKIVHDFVKEYGDFGLERLDGSEVTIERLSEAAQSLPFLAAKKLVILDSPSSNKQFLEQFETILTGAPETNEIVLVEGAVDKRTAYYKWLKKRTDFQDCVVLDERSLTRWAVEYTKEQGGSLSQGEASYLIARVGLNQQQLASELDKLLLADKKIDRTTIDSLTEPSPQSTIFSLLDAAFAGNGRRALELYQEQRALKVEPQQIIAMLGWQLHILVLVLSSGGKTPDGIATETKISPYTIKRSVTLARGRSLASLRQSVRALTALDVRSKRVALDVDGALQTYLLQLGRTQ